MKLSAYFTDHGMQGTMRNVRTGETIHFDIPKRSGGVPFEVNMGGHRFEAKLIMVPYSSGRKEDPYDMQLRLIVPYGETGSGALDPLPKPAEGPKYPDAPDGAPMGPDPLHVPPPTFKRHFLKDGLPPEVEEKPEVRPQPAEEPPAAVSEALEPPPTEEPPPPPMPSGRRGRRG